MPPLILFAIAGAGLYAGYKLYSKLIEDTRAPQRDDRARRREAANVERGAKNLGELEWDEKTGAYVPKKTG